LKPININSFYKINLLMAPMTPTERKLFREVVIREYKLKQEATRKKQYLYNNFVKKLKHVAPFNIVMGIAACITLVIIRGWDTLAYLLLSGIIWLTITSTILSALLKSK